MRQRNFLKLGNTGQDTGWLSDDPLMSMLLTVGIFFVIYELSGGRHRFLIF